MKVDFRALVAASLLSTTAIVPAAIAQEQPQQGIEPSAAEGQLAVQGDECERLQTIVDEQRDTFQQVWIDEATGVVEQGDAAQCVPYIQQAEAAIQRLDSGEQMEQTADGRIIVQQAAPEVAVQIPDPEVTVQVPEPDVTVQQAQPQIIVRQVQPTVTIEMPQPTVRIDQPPPEIIVRMPEPEVNVAQAQPQIEVEQAQPQVEVELAEPQVQIQQPEVAVQESGEAEIAVEQGQPVVQLLEGEEQANVQVEQAQPQVTFEAAEPQVEFTGGGEPQVEFTQSGEPTIQVEQAAEGGEPEGGAEQQLAQAETEGEQPQPMAEGEAAEGADVEVEVTEDAAEEMTDEEATVANEQDWLAGRPVATAPVVEREGYQAAPVEQLTAENLMDADVYTVNDENIGSINDVVVDDAGQVEYVVLDIGGFLGLGGREVALGFDELTFMQSEGGDDLRAFVDMTEEQLEQMPEYQAAGQ